MSFINFLGGWVEIYEKSAYKAYVYDIVRLPPPDMIRMYGINVYAINFFSDTTSTYRTT